MNMHVEVGVMFSFIENYKNDPYSTTLKEEEETLVFSHFSHPEN